MFDRQSLITRVDSYLKHELKSALPGKKRLLSITIPVQEIRLRTLPALDGNWFYRDHPGLGERILGLGEALRIAAVGPDRFSQLNREMKRINHDWEWIDLELTGFHPRTFVCLAFDPNDPMRGPWQDLPNSGLFLPELTLQQQDNYCAISFSVDLDTGGTVDVIHRRWMERFTELVDALLSPHIPPGCKTELTRITTSLDRGHWRDLITQAHSDIETGQLEKVVLARHLNVQAQRRLDPRQLMSTLSYLYPSSVLLATCQGNRVFVSATPELLARSDGNQIACDAVAGTIHRSAVELRDDELGSSLINDLKARHEHQLVVDGITESLQPLCTELETPDQPSLIKLRNLQHLISQIRGRLKSGTSLLQAAEKLHPTAAINGTPSQRATSWLVDYEDLDRGWYAGTAGWIDCRGRGELDVLLRCALLENDQADLFAGAGITAGSDADAEYDETELKLSVMLEALENS